MIVVSDTSVITSLIHIGRAGLLQELYHTVLIPTAVQRELLRTHQQLPAFLEARPAADRILVARLEAELDLGEAEAIVLAKETNADLLLIDEKLGRQVALREGLRITGLIGLVIEAKQQRIITSVRKMINWRSKRASACLTRSKAKPFVWRVNRAEFSSYEFLHPTQRVARPLRQGRRGRTHFRSRRAAVV